MVPMRPLFPTGGVIKMEVSMPFLKMLTSCRRSGFNVAINSDDAEQARHLNQEAAKSVKYAGMSETGCTENGYDQPCKHAACG